MGFFDKFNEIINGGDEDDFDDYYDDRDNKFGISAPDRAERPRKERTERPKREEKTAPERSHSRSKDDKIVNIHTTTQVQVVLHKPDRYEDATTIADNLNDNRTVVVNFESAQRDLARRMLDFLTGVCYANHGQIRRVANSTYIITPGYVDVQGDLLDELENNGMFM